MKRYYKFVIAALTFLLSGICSAQGSISDFAKTINPQISSSANDNELKSIYEKVLKDPAVLNFVVKETFKISKANNLLNGFDFKFKTFEVERNTFLGVAYSYSKNLKSFYFSSDAATKQGLNFSLSAEGNVSLEKSYNPDNFLKSAVSFRYFNSSGGVVEITDEISLKMTEIEKKLSLLSREEINGSRLWKDYLAFVSGYLTTQFYFDFSVKGALESNQDYSSKQYAFGAQLGLDLKAWNRNSTLSQINFFDWPFAFIRWLAATDENISPRGSAIPVLLLNVDLIDPQNDYDRKILKQTDQYFRFGLESSFKTFVGRIGEQDLFFSADVRYFREFNPSAVIKNAGLDEAFYFTAALTRSDGVFFSYSTGKLPLDIKKDEVYSLGFQYKF